MTDEIAHDGTSGAPSDRTRVRRSAERAVYDHETIVGILAEGLVAHVGVVTEDGSPVVIPMAYAVDGDQVLLHGSTASRLMRTAAPICVTVTILDGLVVARSLFSSSMNYRSVVILATPVKVTGADKKAALERLSDHLLPGRVGQARGPNDKELRATTVWRLPLTEASAKIRTGPAEEDPDDVGLPYWGGVIPLRMVAEHPVPDDVVQALDTPDHIRAWARNR